MVAKIRQSGAHSPSPIKPEVGEIDTSPPFQSVKDAVSLFGEAALSGEKPAIKKSKSYSTKGIWSKETKLHLAQKELKKLKERLQNAEATEALVLEELEKSRSVAEDLRQKLKVLNESRESAIQATEASKSQVKQLKEENYGNLDGTNGSWKEELETTVKQYASIITELDVAKQELRNIHQGYDSSLEAKVSAFKQAAEAEDAMKANTERASELSKEILAVQKSVEKIKAAAAEARQQQAGIIAEENVPRQSYEASHEESQKKLLALKMEFNPELTENLEVQLAETMDEIGALQKEMENKKTSDSNSLKSVTLELGNAKESLQKVAKQENSLKSFVESLRVDLENVKREHAELEEKESETEFIVANLEAQLEKSKSELEIYMSKESDARHATEEMILKLNQLSSKTENARREAEDMKNMASELKMEAAVTKLALEDAEAKLKVALEEAEAAEAAEANVLNQIKVLSERTNTDTALSSTSESGAQITISREEFESLTRKIEESDILADIKVAVVKAQIEALKANEDEALQMLEETQKENEDIKIQTQEALRKAEMDEAAKMAVERELTRWRQREQKKAAEAAARILTETQISSELSPQHYRIQKQNSPPKNVEARKLEKAKVTVSKKVLLPNISGIFHRKKNQVEGGSDSYLPGENPV